MPVSVPSAFETIVQLRHPGVIGAMTALTEHRKQALARQGDEQQQQDDAGAETTLTVKDGRPVINVKNMPASSASDEADQTSQILDENLKRNVSIYNDLNQKAATAAPTSKADKWKRAYAEALMRTRGGLIGSMVARDIADTAANVPEESPQAKIAGDYYKENVQPLLAQQSGKLAEDRYRRLLSKDEREEIKGVDYTSPEAAGQPPDKIAEMVLGHPIKPEQAAYAKLVAAHQTNSKEEARAKTAAEIISKLAIQDVAGLEHPEDRQKYVDTVAATVPGGMNKDEKDKLEARVNGLARRYKSLDDREKAQLQLEKERVATAARQNEIMAQSAANAQNPESIAEAVKQIELDPNAYYTPQLQDKKNSAFRQAVDNALQAKHGRVPSKPNTDDVKAISFARLGLMDLDAMDLKASQWEKVGVPLTGAAVGRYNAAEGKLGSPIPSAVDARRLIPGFAKLTPEQQQQYIADAQYYNTRGNILLTREVKLATGGRGGQYMLPIIERSTPGLLTGGAIRTGRASGLRDEFNNRLSVSRGNSWGGVDPLGEQTTGDSTPAGPLVKDTKTFDQLFGAKKKKP